MLTYTFADMPYDMQLRLLRNRLEELASADDRYQEMLAILRDKTPEVFHIPTTRTVVPAYMKRDAG